MKPYYQDSLVTIYHGDCREIVPSLPDEKYVVVTDPPYEETKLKWDAWPAGWPDLAATIAESMWCFGSFRMFMSKWEEFGAWNLSQDVVWEKQNGTGSLNDRFRRTHELAVFFYRRGSNWKKLHHKTPTTPEARKKRIWRRQQPPTWRTIGSSEYRSEDRGPRLMGSVIYSPNCHGYAVHDTQKPEAIVRPLVQYACATDATRIDFFGGSFTTARVAKDLGIRAVAMDINEADCEKGARRMAQEVLLHA